MGSAERYSPEEMQAASDKSVEHGAPPKRPTLVSPPRRPVTPEPVPEPKESAKTPPKASKPLEARAIATSAPEVIAPATEAVEAASRYQPIAPPSEPMQYRAIGLVRGVYAPQTEEEFNRGTLTTDDGSAIDSVLLGRVTSLVKKHVDLSQSHIWVVYPRTRRQETEDDPDLHLQIVGIWEPETLGLPGEGPDSEDEGESKGADPAAASADIAIPSIEDNYFSIRGEVLKYSPEDSSIAVKILQNSKRTPGTSKAFRLMIKGDIEGKTVGYFWDFKVKREAQALIMEQGSVVGIVPPKKRKKGAKGAIRKGGPRPSYGAKPAQSRRPSIGRDIPRPKKQV